MAGGREVNYVIGNTVSGAFEDGLYMSDEVLISRNSFFGNAQLGIDLPSDDDVNPGVTLNDAGDGDSHLGNSLLNFPVITGADGQAVTGTVCARCIVELFISDDDPSGYGEGMEFLEDERAPGLGDFTIPICGLGLEAGEESRRQRR